ncbi:sentrin-specific protease 1 [Caerostris extrusa]|uniref:Sentrin-specific protease 1 n=1 Tax=Caerostris extrusa TaxID=172846 RepID=A0AAV4Y8F9_CAEEX|nr:sentrin-specific protease 1 [Caerostris extrusa]
MSPLRLSHTRKRRSEESSSSESDQDFEDVRPVKKPRGCNGDTNLTDALTSKFKDVCQWLSELHIPNFFSQNMSRKIEMENNSTDKVVEEIPNQEIDVIDISDSDDDVSQEIIPLEKEISSGKGLGQNLQKAPLQETPNPLSSSTPFYKTHGRKLSSLSDKPVNGFHGNGKRLTLISNPGVDIEVLLDTQETPVEVSDDELEIVSEISRVKHSKKLTRQPISPIDKRASSSKKYNNVSPQNNILNGSDKKLSSFNKTFTAHEVVRLQEKAQYQLLLDKVIGGGCNYIPAAHKNTKPPPEIEVDLTQDDDEPAGINRFKETDRKPYEDIQIVEIKRAEKTTNNAKNNGHKKGLYSSAWIEELKMTINAETQQRLKLVTEQEEKLERYRKRRDEKSLNKGFYVVILLLMK